MRLVPCILSHIPHLIKHNKNFTKLSACLGICHVIDAHGICMCLLKCPNWVLWKVGEWSTDCSFLKFPQFFQFVFKSVALAWPD